MEAATRLLTVREFATRAGLAERTVRELIATGRLPVVRQPFGLDVVRIPLGVLTALAKGARRQAGVGRERPRPTGGSARE